MFDAAVVGSPNAATTWSLRDLATGIVSTAAVTLGSSGDGEAVVAGHAVPVALANRRRRARAILGAGNGDQRVVAPMPGKVVKVLVAVGDSVEARQGLVVVEAMKMENELTVSRAGTVAKIEVTEGTSVEAGRLLIVVSCRPVIAAAAALLGRRASVGRSRCQAAAALRGRCRTARASAETGQRDCRGRAATALEGAVADEQRDRRWRTG